MNNPLQRTTRKRTDSIDRPLDGAKRRPSLRGALRKALLAAGLFAAVYAFTRRGQSADPDWVTAERGPTGGEGRELTIGESSADEETEQRADVGAESPESGETAVHEDATDDEVPPEGATFAGEEESVDEADVTGEGGWGSDPIDEEETTDRGEQTMDDEETTAEE